jgi:PST family polysaccharide transporter
MITGTTPVNSSSASEARNERHFSTDHLTEDLKGRSVRGGVMTFAAQVIKFILAMGSTMVLARLLKPEDFGLVAMVFAVTSFVGLFKDAGLSMATVQRPDINHDQISTLFWINISISLLLMVATAALAPAIVWFYDESRLLWITLVSAGTFIFGGLTVQHQALLRRQMRFTVLAVIQIVSMTAGIIAAITIALLTNSYWALVIMPATAAATNAILVWVFCNWRPRGPHRGTGVRPLLTFGFNMLAGSVIWNLNQNIYLLFVGRALGAGELGYFSKAYRLMLVLLRKLNAPLYSVSFPALSALQKHPQRFREYYRRAIGTMALLSMPVAVLLVVAAEHAVLTIFGDQWIKSVPVCRALGPAAFLGAINLSIAAVIIPIGKPEREWRIKVFYLFFHIIALFVGLKWGIVGAATAFSITQIILFLPSHYYGFHQTPIRLSDLGAAVWHAAVASLSAGILTELIVSQLSIVTNNILLGFSIIVIAFAFMYTCFLLLLPGGPKKVKKIIHLVESFKLRSRN